MQNRIKIMRKKSEKDLNLPRSLSARISPLAFTQRFIPGSIDLEALLKLKAYDTKSGQSLKKNHIIVKNSPSGPQLPVKLGKTSNNPSLDKKINLRKQKEQKLEKDVKDESTDENLAYINELKSKLFEVLEENKKFKKQLQSKKNNKKKKLWNVVEGFKSKLQTKLLGHSISNNII
ncbi:hypothetical protein SteCoe_29035 [Stentor coeruleus]|uniref:Uncharacterized protein n=1 Tax=Stentor coeruleus TaxID=5963 RepID=A0A1R2B780_9CILI|nr:hypothetical protein SteCoe_29035 [Stentor coeruleus]